jgi:hypothetical protein
MEEKILFEYVTKDGEHHPFNAKVTTIVEAAYELLESIALGDLKVDPRDIVSINYIPC